MRGAMSQEPADTSWTEVLTALAVMGLILWLFLL
jgi:hypothetical protein